MQLWKLLAIGAAACIIRMVWVRMQQGEKRKAVTMPQLNAPVTPQGFTAAALAQHRGLGGDPSDILVSVKDVVYRVSPQHYGPGANYECFAGSDASYRLGKSLLGREHENRDWRDAALTSEEHATLDGWADAFAKKYPVVGWFVHE
jgi:hypothetical protein